jgi:hypothetical protein
MRALRFEPKPIFPTSRLKARRKIPIERKSEKTIWTTIRDLLKNRLYWETVSARNMPLKRSPLMLGKSLLWQ